VKRYKTPDTDKNLAEMLQTGDNTSRSEIIKLFNSIRNKEELQQQWKESITVHIYKAGDATDSDSYQFHINFIKYCLEVNSIRR
jgi:hypothetical protein